MISNKDQEALYRYASTLEGGKERDTIIAGLKKATMNKKAVAAILARKRQMIRGKGRAAAIRLASSLPAGSEDRKVLLAGLQKSAPTFVRVASDVLAAEKWVEVALKELAVELDLDVDDFKVRGKTPWGHGVNVEGRRGNNGESEWMLFKDDGDAYDEAYAYVKEMLEEEPESFNQNFLEHYMAVSPGDARQIGLDDAEHRVDGMDDEDLLAAAGMEDKWEELNDEWGDHENRIDGIEDELLDAISAEDEEAEERLEDEKSDAEKRMAQIEKEKEKLIDEARDEALSTISDEVEAQLLRDPAGYIEEVYGYRTLGDYARDVGGMPSWIHIDVDKAAKAVLRDDGVAYYLDRYDSDYVELASGAEAYGTN